MYPPRLGRPPYPRLTEVLPTFSQSERSLTTSRLALHYLPSIRGYWPRTHLSSGPLPLSASVLWAPPNADSTRQRATAGLVLMKLPTVSRYLCRYTPLLHLAAVATAAPVVSNRKISLDQAYSTQPSRPSA